MGYIEIAIGWQAAGTAMDDLYQFLGIWCLDGGGHVTQNLVSPAGNDEYFMIPS